MGEPAFLSEEVPSGGDMGGMGCWGLPFLSAPVQGDGDVGCWGLPLL